MFGYDVIVIFPCRIVFVSFREVGQMFDVSARETRNSAESTESWSADVNIGRTHHNVNNIIQYSKELTVLRQSFKRSKRRLYGLFQITLAAHQSELPWLALMNVRSRITFNRNLIDLHTSGSHSARAISEPFSSDVLWRSNLFLAVFWGFRFYYFTTG